MLKKYAMRLFYRIIVIFMLLPSILGYADENIPVSPGSPFPRVIMKPISVHSDLAYLGLKEGMFFTVDDISCDIALIEIMNTNCISCKKQAPVYNELLSMIAADQEMQQRIKVLAIAVGNSDKEIETFKNQYKVRYPIIGDPQYLVWDATGRTKTPLTIVVKRERAQPSAIVVGVHPGFQPEAKTILDRLRTYLTTPLPKLIIQTPIEKGEKNDTPAPVFSEQQMMELIVMSLFKAGIVSQEIKTVRLEKSGVIYAGTGKMEGQPVQIFAKLILRFLPCDACHEVQFLYLFDGTGKILDLIPIQLTKYGNQPFSEEDLNKIQTRFVGRFIFDAFDFNPEVDAVSRATISSSVIFKAFGEGRAVFDELKAIGMVPGI